MKPRPSRARQRVMGLRSSRSLSPISRSWTRKDCKELGIDTRSLMMSFLGFLIWTRGLARPNMMMWLFMKPISILV